MEETKVDQKLDLSGEVCPYTFVKTKLTLEDMESGEVLEVILDAGEPVLNVPRSVKEEGHKVIKIERMNGTFRVLIKKT
ncbi:MAG: sulfurtransferase TusA family protein [Firmicutes bacterium]|nr:sulfurtransferase TusA family protein [Bacillota bacterium]